MTAQVINLYEKPKPKVEKPKCEHDFYFFESLKKILNDAKKQDDFLKKVSRPKTKNNIVKR